MGEDIDDCPYAGGEPCEDCEDVLFNGCTPQYVLATFQGISPCPLGSGIDFNGAFLLEQIPGVPCSWLFDTGDAFVSWQIDVFSQLTIIEHFGFARQIFIGLDGNPCVDEFLNSNIICGGLAGAIGGAGIVSWGCSIRP